MDISTLLQAIFKKDTSPKIDKRFYDTIYAEVGGGDPQEVNAVASVFYNLTNDLGYEKALKRSSAYRKKSKEYEKASNSDFTEYEQYIYNRNKKIINDMLSNPDYIQSYTHLEIFKCLKYINLTHLKFG